MGLVLAAIAAGDPGKHRDFRRTIEITGHLADRQTSNVADLVIEFAPSALLRAIVAPFVSILAWWIIYPHPLQATPIPATKHPHKSH